MENRKLEVYTFTGHPKRKPSETVALENVFSIDLYKQLKSKFANFVDTFPPLHLEGKTSKIEKIKLNGKTESIFKSNDTYRYIAGKIKIGDDDGKEQDVVNNDKEKTVLYTKLKGQTVERPFFFMVIVPLGYKHGFVILERDGQHSAKRVFEKLFKKFVASNLSDLQMSLTNFVDNDLIKDFLEDGTYNTIILSQKIASKDKAEQYLGAYIDGAKYKVELKITPLQNSVIPIGTKQRIIKNLEENNGFFQSAPFEQIGFDDSANVKVVSTNKGNTRTIDLDDTFKIRPYYVISVSNDNKGFSDFEEIRKEAKKLIRSFNLKII